MWPAPNLKQTFIIQLATGRASDRKNSATAAPKTERQNPMRMFQQVSFTRADAVKAAVIF